MRWKHVPLASLRRFRRGARGDADAVIPTKDWNKGFTPTEKGVRPLVHLGTAEVDQTYARKLRRLLPPVHGREQRIDGLVERGEDIELRRDAIAADVERIEEENREHLGFMPLVGLVLEALVVLGLAVSSIPMDAGAFQIVPLDQRVLYMAVVAIGAIIALATVAIGRGIKHLVEVDLPLKKLIAYSVATGGGLLALEFLAVPGLAFLREQFVKRVATDAGATSIDFVHMGAAFTKLQMALVFIGVVVSFLAHNPAAARRRHLRLESGWLGMRLWLLNKRLHTVEVALAVVGARLSATRMRFDAMVDWVVAYCAYLPEYYRTHLLHRHPQAQDPDVGNRPPVIVPQTLLATDPERWSATPRRFSRDWLANLRDRRQRRAGHPSSNGHSTDRAPR